MNYKGVIIEESLEDKGVLKKIKILKTRVERVVEKHKTPWLKQWTLHTVEIKEHDVGEIAKLISKSLDKKHPSWYADFKSQKYHYIIFPDKIFTVGLSSSYQEARDWGISIGIPEYQMQFERLKR